MSGGQEDVSSQPLVIVRRRRNTEEAHHGGVWKIAYADFMTAMMAFFLVMWLVNAADKKTIVQVAAYFNPIRLTDRTITPKGLEEMTEDAKPLEKEGKAGYKSKEKNEHKEKSEPPPSDGTDTAGEAGAAASEAGAKKAQSQKEQALFDNPGDTLDKLADEAKTDQTAESDITSSDTGEESDVFDRQARTQRKKQGTSNAENKGAAVDEALSAKPVTVPSPQDAPTAAKERNARKNKTPDRAPGVTNPSPPDNAAIKDGKLDAKKEEKKDSTVEDKKADKTEDKKEDKTEDKTEDKKADKTEDKKEDKTEDKKADKAEDKKEDKTEEKLAGKAEAAERIESELSSAISKVSRKLPHIEVHATSEGMLISLTDDANFGMFEVGSAKPRPELVVIMSKVGEMLKTTPGKIVIRGHTDSRAYKTGNYDNWRLSAARAQMAYYMLVRGGVPETNFIAVEGRADRDPKLPNDTEAAQNRRIDILVREAPP